MSKVFDYYKKAKEEGKAKVKLSKALENFDIENAIKRAEKIVKTQEDVYLVPCITGETQIKEIDGEIFIEICLS